MTELSIADIDDIIKTTLESYPIALQILEEHGLIDEFNERIRQKRIEVCDKFLKGDKSIPRVGNITLH